jgi:hypothetical protein
MPSYAELATEPVWGAQFVPTNMTNALIVPLRNFYSLGPASIGAPGDNNHLYGRHRSANWDRQSRYCTNRAYGTVDARDKLGNQNWYRAIDTGIQGKTLQDASHRMDALVRSGKAPGVAEWFGTFDGNTVVGWYEGHPSSSDDSHLFHLHVGVWNANADDAALMRLLYSTITNTNVIVEDDMSFIARDEARRLIIINNDWTGFFRMPADYPGGETQFIKDRAFWGATDRPVTDPATHDFKVFATSTRICGVDLASVGSGGGGGTTGPVDLTPSAVAQVADASANKTANEIAERLATP